ncbi:hypothetical protein XELAEV_18027006mg [Xenopus laevis]|uniref:Uncharacterized protein n=1 Tax=Xenopus laevis TaxID=8355 RepID=A0A974HJK7_XENLA|nr:hypothetical protein XELAEV_18027006mg [Xenopus laevis]
MTSSPDPFCLDVPQDTGIWMSYTDSVPGYQVQVTPMYVHIFCLLWLTVIFDLAFFELDFFVSATIFSGRKNHLNYFLELQNGKSWKNLGRSIPLPPLYNIPGKYLGSPERAIFLTSIGIDIKLQIDYFSRTPGCTMFHDMQSILNMVVK